MKQWWARPKHKKFLHYPQNTSCLDDFSHRSPVKDLNKYDDGYSSSLTRPYYITGKLYTCGHTIPGQFSSLVIGSTEWDLGKSLGSVFVLLSFLFTSGAFYQGEKMNAAAWREWRNLTQVTQLSKAQFNLFYTRTIHWKPNKTFRRFMEWCT